jgi:predicted 2-oxoglutarate/Fe(II)-dependent dioxygenase YbiX
MYIDAGFLDDAACLRIRRAMDAGAAEAAEILREAFEQRPRVRRAHCVDVDARVIGEIERRLDVQREAIARFYELPLGEREGAGLMRYPRGGYYRPHRDRADVPAWPAAARRTIAVVVFLNSSRDRGTGDFSGGRLRLFLDDHAIDVAPAAGTLIAFPADVLHEVTEVQDGTRDTIVDWFY